MADGLSYDEKIIKAFRETPLRTVLMIDDHFPTFSDLAKAASEAAKGTLSSEELERKFPQRERAMRLYEMFRKHGMACDIDNLEIAPDDKIDVERIRKSDLIVLDYNLNGDHSDNRKSIALLSRLADTSHFNTVVLYTINPDLNRVWQDVALGLSRGWHDPETILNGKADALGIWDEIQARNALPDCPVEFMIKCATGDKEKFDELKDSIRGEFVNLGAGRGISNCLVDALVSHKVRQRFPDLDDVIGGEKRSLSGECRDDVRWLQVKNCFIVVVGKVTKREDGATEDNDDIIGYLDAALRDWRPNLLQTLISEIQNILELESLVTDEMHLSNPELQAALFYYLLDRVAGASLDDDGASLIPAIEAVIDRLVESIRRKISSNGAVAGDAANLLSSRLAEEGWQPGGKNYMYGLASKLAGVSGNQNEEKTLFRLNVFLSTEEFKRGHLTTGTVVRSLAEKEYLICMSPSCDMTPRRPGGQQQWTRALFPLRAMIGVKLNKKANISDALREAEKPGLNIFLEIDAKPHAFCLVDENTRQPSYEMLFPTNRGQINPGPLPQFQARRIIAGGGGDVAGDPEIPLCDFEVVGQLRPQYASRFLQIVGQHLSRIGVDFVEMGSEAPA